MATDLQQIIGDIEGIARDAAQQLPPRELAAMLSFLTKVTQVLEQAYRDVIPILIEVKYMDERTLHGPDLTDLLKKIDLVMSISHYREAEEICSRLKTLRNTYETELAQYINPDDRFKWSGLLGLIEEREGRIVILIQSNLYRLQSSLRNASPRDLPGIRQAAAEQMVEVRESLTELNRFASAILGLSGSAGLLEMLRDPKEACAAAQAVSIMIDRRQIMGAQHNYTTKGDQSPIVGAGAHTGNLTFTQSGPSIDLARLAAELAALRRAMKAEATGEAEEDVALGEIAKAEAAAKVGDEQGAMQALKAAGKWAFSVAEKIGVGVAVAAMKPLVGG